MQNLQLFFFNPKNKIFKSFCLLVLALVLSCASYGQQTFGNPVNGSAQISCPFQSQCAHSNPNFQHTALDYGSNNGLNIKATADGRVSRVEDMNSNDHGMGTNIIIEHRMTNGGIKYSSYSHLAATSSGISVGAVVSKGQTIGTMGGSGYGNPIHWGVHLHFEIKNGNVSHNPSGSGTYWGYTPGNPLSWGYFNPTTYLGAQTVIPQPDINSPANGSNNIPVSSTLDWNSVSGATNYRVQVKKSSSSGWTAENGFYSGSGTTSSVVVNQTTGTTSQVSVTLEPNTTYYWTVRVANSNSHSYYSPIRSFTTGSGGGNEPCNDFTSVTASPSNTSVTLSINGMSAGATQVAYRYKARNTSIWNGWFSAGTSTNIGISNLTASTQYDYQIAVRCVADGWKLSSEQSFTTTGSNSGGNTGTGCPGGNQYPSEILYPSNSWQYQNCMYAGEYAKFYVTNGQSYTFSTCSSDGASASYDTELTLMNGSGVVLSYDDDFCGTQSKIIWTSNLSGYIRVRVTQYSCSTNEICTKVGYKRGTAGFNSEPDTNIIAKTKTGTIDNRPGQEVFTDSILTLESVRVSNDSAPEQLGIRLFPNPAADFINVNLELATFESEAVLIQIFNSQGKLIKELKGSTNGNSFNQEIGVAEAISGFYFMKVKVGEEVTVKRFVISK